MLILGFHYLQLHFCKWNLEQLESDKLDLIYSAKKPVENVYLLLPFLLSAGKSLKVICQSCTIIRRQLLNRTPVYF